jgi:TRAP-type mannitol/chloroaromatic compound transport system permease small subunit
MPRWIVAYVRIVDKINYRVGRFSMYLLFMLMGVLLWSSLSKLLNHNAIWTLEMAQFVMVAYYMLGGPYSLQLDSNVRMDLLYHRWSCRTRARVDAFSIFALIFYLVILLWGAVDSTAYSLQYAERSPTAWRPYIAPIKIVMVIGITLMLLQSFAFFFRDLAKMLGKEICEEEEA